MNPFRFVLSLYFLLLPFQFALSPVEGIDLAIIRLITAGIVGVWLLHGLSSQKLFFPQGTTIFLISGFLTLSFCSALWAENGGFSLRKSFFFLSFFPLFFVLSALFFENKASRTHLLQSLVVGATVSAGVGIGLFLLQFVVGVSRVFTLLTEDILPFFLGSAFAQSVAEHPSLLVNISGVTLLRASSVFPDPHMFSLYVALALPVALGFFLNSSSGKEKWVWGVATTLLFTAVLLSFSRGAYVALLFGLIPFFFLSGIWNAWNSRKRWIFLIGTLVFCGILVLGPTGNRFFSSFSGDDGSNRERLRLWSEAVSHIGEHPFFGVGLGNYPLLVNPGAVYRDPIYAHNLFLDVAVELGLIGLFFLMAPFAQAISRALFWWRKQRDWQALSVVGALFIFLGHSFFETPIFSVHILPTIILFLAIGVSYKYDKKHP